MRLAIHACGFCSGEHRSICEPIPRKTNSDVAFLPHLTYPAANHNQTTSSDCIIFFER